MHAAGNGETVLHWVTDDLMNHATQVTVEDCSSSVAVCDASSNF
jgi:hypothetical protein